MSFRTTPLGVASLIGKTMAATKNLEDDFSRLGLFIGTVLAGLAILTFLILPVVYFAFVRKNPFRFLFTMIEPVLITIAASST